MSCGSGYLYRVVQTMFIGTVTLSTLYIIPGHNTYWWVTLKSLYRSIYSRYPTFYVCMLKVYYTPLNKCMVNHLVCLSIQMLSQSASNGWIDFKFGVWLYTDGAYDFSDFWCSLMWSSCFMGFSHLYGMIQKILSVLIDGLISNLVYGFI